MSNPIMEQAVELKETPKVEPAENQELSQMLQLLRGCFRPNPWIYYLDMLLTAFFGYGSVALFLRTPWSHPFLAGAYCLAGAVCLYRLGAFIHEVIHLPRGQMKFFKFLWNALVGVPLVSPHFLYRNHIHHHSVQTYATPGDGEYLPMRQKSGWRAFLALMRSPIALILAPYRFLLLVPVTLLIPGGRKWLLKNASAFPMIPFYRYEKLPAVEPWWVWVDILASAGMWTVTLLIWTGAVPMEYALKIQALVVLGLFLNGFRNLIAHTYRADGRSMGHLGQFEDTYNLEASWLFGALFLPVGLRYHALHHLFPTIPYHNLGKAHQILMKEMPENSSYRRNASVPVGTAFKWLFFPQAAQGENRTQVPGLLRKAAMTVLLAASLAYAGIANANPVDDQPVNSIFKNEDGHYHFTGDFTIDADPQAVWQVLTDYNHVSKFVAHLDTKVRQRDLNHVLVDQTLGDGFLFIRFEVKALLEVHEQAFGSIFVEDISHRHFARYQNVWLLQPDESGKGTKVVYMMDAQRNRHTPGFITADVFKTGLRNFLKQYRYEMVQREEKRRKAFTIVSQ